MVVASSSSSSSSGSSAYDGEDYLDHDSDDDSSLDWAKTKKIKKKEKQKKQSKVEKKAELSSLENAHEMLLELNSDLQRKAQELQAKEKSLLEREEALARQQHTVAAAMEEVEQRRQVVKLTEEAIEKRLEEEERALKQDALLIEERLEANAEEEIELIRDEMEDERANLQATIDSLQIQLAKKTKLLRQAQSKRDLLQGKVSSLESNMTSLRKIVETQTNDLQRLSNELENSRKKLRIQTWKFERTQKQQIQDVENVQANHQKQLQHQVHQAYHNNTNLLLGLINGLAELILSSDQQQVEEEREEEMVSFEHNILPGLCYGLEMNLHMEGSLERSKRLLMLTLHCLNLYIMDKKKRKSRQSNGKAYTSSDGLLHRFSSRLLNVVRNGSFLDCQDSETRILAAMVTVSMNFLTQPFEPGNLQVPLHILANVDPNKERDLMIRFPSCLEPIFKILQHVSSAQWRLCVRHGVIVLLSLSSTKGKDQQRILNVVSQIPGFAMACCKIFDALINLEREKDGLDLVDNICEAASVIAVYLQRLTKTKHDQANIRKLFVGIDLRGILQECERVSQYLISRGSARGSAFFPEGKQDSIEFFFLNCKAILNQF